MRVGDIAPLTLLLINSEVQTFKTLKIDLCSFNGRSWPPFGERKSVRIRVVFVL